jgi:hypothetical protein
MHAMATLALILTVSPLAATRALMTTSAVGAPTLAITLAADQAQFVEGEDISFRGTYRNTGAAPYSLTFWWNRRMRISDATGKEVRPGPGPVLPSGVKEDVTPLAPGQSLERAEPLGCTQPAGRSETIGWSYTLPPGTYRAVLLFAFPPAHGYADRTPDAWMGQVESNAVEFTVVPRPSLMERLLGRRTSR